VDGMNGRVGQAALEDVLAWPGRMGPAGFLEFSVMTGLGRTEECHCGRGSSHDCVIYYDVRDS
jgi:hypothetical protein